jgi:hypothetical protein
LRVPAEDRRQVATVIDGREYRARDGFFDLPERAAAAHLSESGYGRSWMVPGVPRPSGGRRCADCGFGSFFATCGRCGGECPREST